MIGHTKFQLSITCTFIAITFLVEITKYPHIRFRNFESTRDREVKFCRYVQTSFKNVKSIFFMPDDWCTIPHHETQCCSWRNTSLLKYSHLLKSVPGDQISSIFVEKRQRYRLSNCSLVQFDVLPTVSWFLWIKRSAVDIFGICYTARLAVQAECLKEFCVFLNKESLWASHFNALKNPHSLQQCNRLALFLIEWKEIF